MAGEGKRFAQTGEQILKPFIKVDNEFMFVRAMNSIRKMFFNRDIYFELVMQHKTIEKYNVYDIIKDMKNVHINGVGKTIGPAETVCYGICGVINSFVNDFVFSMTQTIVCDCDLEVNSCAFSSVVNIDSLTTNKRHDCILLTHHETNPRYSYVRTDKNGKVSMIAEKNPISDEAIIGTYCFSDLYTLEKYAYRAVENVYKSTKSKKEPYVSDIINEMLIDNLDVFATKLTETDIYNSFGTPEELEEYKNKEEK